ncbi:MAG: RusA family crossover junction endodeoxyribonuclease [Chlorobiaceae bacterium]|nr:RusA family crossover junction endodeoxyribonuclease [Chlorobiaceae bacterium]
MEPISFFVAGKPLALKRHQTVRVKSGRSIEYDPSAGDKADFLAMVRRSAPETPFTGPLEVKMTYFFPRPKSHYGTGKNGTILKISAPHFHTSKPDLDNLEKFILDALNEVFWKDDAQVCRVAKQKVYTDQTPGVMVRIESLSNAKTNG